MLNDGNGMLWVIGDPSAEPKHSPKAYGTPPSTGEFYFHTDCYIHNMSGGKETMDLRFRIFSQISDRNQTMAQNAGLQCLVMENLLRQRLRMDHNPNTNEGIIDLYLCEGGDAGGEQFFGPDQEPTSHDADVILIYDVGHFDGKFEQAREIAHEYGHAVLPPMGGFKDPEYWASGYLGEKLFLRWGRDAMLRGDLSEQDFMGCPFVKLDYWVKTSVDPLENAAAVRDPSSPLLSGSNKDAMGAFEGAALWCDSIMPPAMFSRALLLTESEYAKDFPAGAARAAQEHDWSPKIPDGLKGKAVWIPVGKGRIRGTPVLKRDSGWALVNPSGKFTVVAPPEEAS